MDKIISTGWKGLAGIAAVVACCWAIEAHFSSVVRVALADYVTSVDYSRDSAALREAVKEVGFDVKMLRKDMEVINASK